MQSFRLLIATAATAAFVSGAAMAAPAPFNGKATLANPGSAREALVEGVTWTCAGADCTGIAERYSSLDSRMKECRKVAAALGPLASYERRGLAMSKGDLNVCNKAAATQTAQTSANAAN